MAFDLINASTQTDIVNMPQSSFFDGYGFQNTTDIFGKWASNNKIRSNNFDATGNLIRVGTVATLATVGYQVATSSLFAGTSAIVTTGGLLTAISLPEILVAILCGLGICVGIWALCKSADALGDLIYRLALKRNVDIVEPLTDEYINSIYVPCTVVDGKTYIDSSLYEDIFEILKGYNPSTGTYTGINYYNIQSSGQGNVGKEITETSVIYPNGCLAEINVGDQWYASFKLQSGANKLFIGQYGSTLDTFDYSTNELTLQKRDSTVNQCVLIRSSSATVRENDGSMFGPTHTVNGDVFEVYSYDEFNDTLVKEMFTIWNGGSWVSSQSNGTYITTSTIFVPYQNQGSFLDGVPTTSATYYVYNDFVLNENTNLVIYDDYNKLLEDCRNNSYANAINMPSGEVFYRNPTFTATINDGTALLDVFPALGTNKKSLIETFPETTTASADLVDVYPVSLPMTESIATTPAITIDQSQAGTVTDVNAITDALTESVVAVDSAVDAIRNRPRDSGNSPVLVLPTAEPALYRVYNPTYANLTSFSRWLWSTDFSDPSTVLPQITKLFSNPMDSIISLHKVYCPVNVDGTDSIKLGYFDTGITGVNVVSNSITHVDLGTINLTEYYNNFLDYNPYTSVKVYLPFIGMINLEADTVINSQVNITYDINVATGSCIATINVIKNDMVASVQSFSGNCMVTMPLSSSNLFQSVIGMVGSLALKSPVGVVANSKITTETMGGLGCNVSELCIKKPYVIIKRSCEYEPVNAHNVKGFESNKLLTLNSVTGFTRVSHINTLCIPDATEYELQEIESLLKSGVIF